MIAIFLTLFSLLFYIFFQLNTIFGGDAGDLASAAYVGGTPHPPGFPLYTFLGFLITRIPLGTAAWRMGFLSSIPAAFSLVFLYLSLKKIYKQPFIPLLAVLFIGFSYPVWLYATAVEVFSLNAFFSMACVYLILLWRETRSNRIFILFFFVFGLGFFHHQIIVFLSPAFFYFIYMNRKYLPKSILKKTVFPTLFFLLGAVPYLYTYLSAKSIPAVMWGNPWNFANTVKLFLRDYYGTFYTGLGGAEKIGSRIISGLLFFEFALEDFTILGAGLFITGFIIQLLRIIKNHKKSVSEIFQFLLIFFSGPFYFFYASYTGFTSFRIATVEKFLTFSYPFLAFLICEGLIQAVSFLELLFRKFLLKNKSNLNVRYPLYVFIAFFPLIILFINYPKLSVLKNDFSAERFADDLLNIPENNSILFLQRDTAIFNTFYNYYTRSTRKDVKIFYLQRLIIGEYKEQIKKYYPDLLIPNVSADKFFSAFVEENYAEHPLYSNTNFDFQSQTSGYVWVKEGLLYRIYKAKDLPEQKEIVRVNDELWREYSNPLTGSLGTYQNLFLGNTLDFYSESHREYATYLAKIKSYDKALYHFQEAIALNPNEYESYFLGSNVYFLTNQCKKAEDYLNHAITIVQVNKDAGRELLYLYSKYQNTKDCFKDEKRADKLLRLFKEMEQKLKIPIDKL